MATTEVLQALIIDGDAKRLATLEDVVKNCGFAVVQAEDPMSAQMLIDSEKFHVILCQSELPGGTGLDVLGEFKQSHPEIPFVLMADSPDDPAVAKALEMGAADTFTSPGDFTSLYPKLAAIQAAALDAASKPKTPPPAAAPAPARQAAPTQPKTAVHPVQLPELHASTTKSEPSNVDMILDVPVSVNAILGHTTMKISDLLQLGPGSVVELDKRAGEPLDLYVNDKLIAMGEVVVVNETFGVRITEVIDPKQRVQALS
jgi:flagellar motor switch protein FliN